SAGMQDLGTLGGATSRAWAVADGVVVGEAAVSWGAMHAAVWDGASAVDLGTLGAGAARAVAVNEAGQVAVVLTQGAGAAATTRAAYWDAERGLTGLGTFGGVGAMAAGISETGRVIGWARTADG